MADKKTVPGSNLPEPSEAEKTAARKEGVAEALKESAKDSYQYLTDGQQPGAPPARQFTGSDEIMQFSHYLDLGVAEFKAAIKEDGGLPEEKVAGLLKLERAGQNRTDYVKALMARLDVKSPYEVTNAGPGYTNDVTNVTAL